MPFGSCLIKYGCQDRDPAVYYRLFVLLNGPEYLAAPYFSYEFRYANGTALGPNCFTISNRVATTLSDPKGPGLDALPDHWRPGLYGLSYLPEPLLILQTRFFIWRLPRPVTGYRLSPIPLSGFSPLQPYLAPATLLASTLSESPIL
jgi:hypothetical protein